MFFTYLRRELRRRMRQAVFISLGLALGIGLVITVIVRLLLVGLGIHPHLRPKALVYVCFAILFTMGVWLVFFKK